MSNPESESNSSGQTENHEANQENVDEKELTDRQRQSALPSLETTKTSPEQLTEQLQSLSTGSKGSTSTSATNSNASNNNDETSQASASAFILRAEAVEFSPGPTATTQKTEASQPEASSFVYDLSKYDYDYFISKLTGKVDNDFAQFGSPSGICSLNDDRLLVANFDRDSLLLFDLNGEVHQFYKDLPTPKDVLLYSASPSQAAVALRKELIIYDLETSKTVSRSRSKGFYPWNIQYLPNQGYFAACDPSGERIVFLDKNLAEIGEYSFKNQAETGIPGSNKTYPYTAYFLAEDSFFALTHYERGCRLGEYDLVTKQPRRMPPLPETLKSYSIFVDSARKCLIADIVGSRLLSIDENSQSTERRWKSLQEPYSMTFLANGTLCVTCRSKSFGSNGGVAIISQTDLKSQKRQ